MALYDVFASANVTLAAPGAKSASGGVTYGTAVSVKAKVIYEELLFTSPTEGRQKVSKVQIIVAPTVTVAIGYKAVVDGVDYTVGFIKKPPMFKRIDRKKCMLVI